MLKKMVTEIYTTTVDKVSRVWNKYTNNVKVKKASDPVNVKSFGRSWLGFSPLWCRIVIASWALTVTMWSLTIFSGPLYLWLIYLTHWGLLLILAESVFGVAVAVAKKLHCLKDEASALPWYVRIYWMLYNTSTALAFLITIFYWCLLYGRIEKMNFILDVNLHGMNSALVALELATAAHPSRLAHWYHPGALGLVYLVFGLVYYFAGGVDPYGHPYIYPTVDWSNPKPTSVVVTLTALSLVLAHVVIVALAAARDALVTHCRGNHRDVCSENDKEDAVV